MTNADELIERARLAQKMVPRAIDVFEQAVFIGSVIDDLAVALREARRDSERLDWMLSMRCPNSMLLFAEAEVALAGGRDGIDAAMGGEAETHD